jgi:hypothetical protein
MTTKTLTPQQIDEALDAAEAEAERLRAKQAAIAAAEHDARHAEELSLNPWMGDFVWSLTRFS